MTRPRREAAGERLDVFLGGVRRHAGEGAAADRRRVGAGRRRGGSRSGTCSPAAKRWTSRSRRPRPSSGVAVRRSSDRLRGRPPAGGQQAARGGRASRGRAAPGDARPGANAAVAGGPTRTSGRRPPTRPRHERTALLLAPTRHAALQAALRARDTTREYLALVEGRPPARRGTIDAPLGRDRRVRTQISTHTDDPHDAVTHFAAEQVLPEDTLLRVTLETGRTHQIRAHLLAIGHPVVERPGVRARRKSTDLAGNSFTPSDSRSITPKVGHRWICGRRCRRTWSGPSGRREWDGRTNRCRGAWTTRRSDTNAGARGNLPKLFGDQFPIPGLFFF